MKKTHGVSIHELKRRLMRRMTTAGRQEATQIAVTIREHAAAISFSGHRSIDTLCLDIDHGAAWDRLRMEWAIRKRLGVK